VRSTAEAALIDALENLELVIHRADPWDVPQSPPLRNNLEIAQETVRPAGGGEEVRLEEEGRWGGGVGEEKEEEEEAAAAAAEDDVPEQQDWERRWFLVNVLRRVARALNEQVSVFVLLYSQTTKLSRFTATQGHILTPSRAARAARAAPKSRRPRAQPGRQKKLRGVCCQPWRAGGRRSRGSHTSGAAAAVERCYFF
jgi:hypothetical protein